MKISIRSLEQREEEKAEEICSKRRKVFPFGIRCFSFALCNILSGVSLNSSEEKGEGKELEELLNFSSSW